MHHRNISPSNIFVIEEPRFKLANFNLYYQDAQQPMVSLELLGDEYKKDVYDLGLTFVKMCLLTDQIQTEQEIQDAIL